MKNLFSVRTKLSYSKWFSENLLEIEKKKTRVTIKNQYI